MDKEEWLRIHREIQFWGLLAWGLAFPGICLLVAGISEVSVVVTPSLRDHQLVGQILILLGLGFYGGGLSAYARRKGLHPAWGLMGLSCLIGLFVIRFLPKRCRGCERACPGRTFDCPGCGAPI